MFFVLSGFLITWLLLKENENFGTVSLRAFYMRRSLRIFPAFYCYAAIALGIAMVTHRSIFWPQTLASLMYVNNYYQAIHGHTTSPFSHTWSLGIEEQFYLLWPALFLAFRRNYRRLAWVLCILILSFWAYRAILFFRFHIPEVYFYEAFDARADHLLIGCLLAVVLRASFAQSHWLTICNPGMSLVVVGLLVISNACEYVYGHSYRDTIGAIANPLLAAAFIAQVIAMADTRMWGWLNTSGVRYVGRISYSIYLYQAIAMGTPKKLLASYPVIVQLAGCVGAVLGVASLSYFVVERPFLALRKGFEPEDLATGNRALSRQTHAGA